MMGQHYCCLSLLFDLIDQIDFVADAGVLNLARSAVY
jgi:hypothetical protein